MQRRFSTVSGMPLESGPWPEPGSNRNLAMSFIFDTPARTALEIFGQNSLFPVHRVYCVGRNYAAHAIEMGHDGREPPFFFSKPADALVQAGHVAWPPATSDLHHEVELVVALGQGGENLDEKHALDLVLAYAVGVDLTRRDLQRLAKQQSRPWDVAKGFDQSAPISKLQLAADIGHPASGNIELAVDGEVRQSGDLSDMIWPVAGIISELSRYFTLLPGDIIFTGTPEGVGPLKTGQRVKCAIEGVASHDFRIGDDRN